MNKQVNVMTAQTQSKLDSETGDIWVNMMEIEPEKMFVAKQHACQKQVIGS